MKYNLLLLTISLLLTFTTSSFARPGDPDPTFNQTGTNRVGFNDGGGGAQAMAEQDDGKYIIAGSCQNGTGPAMVCLARFDQNGSVDSTFGDNGWTSAAFDGDWHFYSTSIAIQPDGKILVAGAVYTATTMTMALARFDMNGSLDETFASGPRPINFLRANNRTQLMSIALQSDGRIIGVGTSFSNTGASLLITRFNIDGGFDLTFGNGGVKSASFGAGWEYSWGQTVVVQNDDKFLIAGGYRGHVAIERFMSDGTLDTSFGYGGQLGSIISPGAGSQCFSVLSDGKMIVAGTQMLGDQKAFAVERFLADGTPDATFDGDGIAYARVPGRDPVPHAIAVKSNGKVVVAGIGDGMMVVQLTSTGHMDLNFNHRGMVSYPGAYDGYAIKAGPDGEFTVAGGLSLGPPASGLKFGTALFRFADRGGLVSSFGTSGVAVQSVGHAAVEAGDMTVQDDGGVIWVGSTRNKASVARIKPDGRPDEQFGDRGRVIFDSAGGTQKLNAVRMLPDGRIMAVGFYHTDVQLSGLMLVRLLPDGAPDSTFNGTGVLISTIGDAGKAMVIQPDGKILVSGYDRYGFTSFIARFLPDGTLDSDFADNGVRRFALNYRSISLNSIGLYPDGRIVGCGLAVDQNGYDAVLVRLNEDGSNDTAFGVDGMVTTGTVQDDDVHNSLAITPDGKIVTGGFSGERWRTHSTISQYNENGTLNRRFGVGGRTILPLSEFDEIRSVFVQTDGSIVAAGSRYAANRQFMVVTRFLANGTPDRVNFGSNGTATVPFSENQADGNSITQDAAGNILVGGTAGGLLAIARLKSE
jgi:uncharacterized delta-60 repeat protein